MRRRRAGLIARLGAMAVKPLGCFVGEPTGMDVVVGHKGKRSFRVDVRGRTCHSSLAPEGVNAVEYAARLIVNVRDVADRLAREGARDPLYDVPYTTMHTGVVRAAPRSISCRTSAAPVRVSRDRRRRCRCARRRGDGLCARSARAGYEGRRSRGGDHFRHDVGISRARDAARGDVVALAKTFAQRNDHRKVAFGTEAGLFAEAGIPTVVVGPGSIEQAHKADEFVAKSELESCSKFVDRLIAHCRV